MGRDIEEGGRRNIVIRLPFLPWQSNLVYFKINSLAPLITQQFLVSFGKGAMFTHGLLVRTPQIESGIHLEAGFCQIRYFLPLDPVGTVVKGPCDGCIQLFSISVEELQIWNSAGFSGSGKKHIV